MKIRSILAATAAFGVLAAAGAASASITITAIPAAAGDAALGHGVANGGLLANGQVMIDNFGDNGGSQLPSAGFTFNPQVFDQDGVAAGYIRTGTPGLLGGESAAPPVFGGDYEAGNYYTVTSDCENGGTGCAHTATLTVTQGWLTNFSFYLGSPDAFNTVQFFDANGQVGATLAGNAIWDCASCGQGGDQTFGARAVYDFGGARVTSVVFGSSGNSFEFDNLAGTVAVPEPATWAMMLLGFGGIGAMIRRRRAAVAFG